MREYRGAINVYGRCTDHGNILDYTEFQRQIPPRTAINKPGSRIGALILLVFSKMALFAALILPALVSARKYFTMRHVWITSHDVFGLSMLGTFVIRSTTGRVLLFGTVGYSWSASVRIRYALLGAETSSPSPPGKVLISLRRTKIAWSRKGIVVAIVRTAMTITTCQIIQG